MVGSHSDLSSTSGRIAVAYDLVSKRRPATQRVNDEMRTGKERALPYMAVGRTGEAGRQRARLAVGVVWVCWV